MKLNRILIRVDAGGITGTGHVMRMIALAQAYLRRGGSVSMVSVNCPDRLVERVHSHGIEHYFINAAHSGNSDDAVLLARDDAENHLQYAQPFLEAGIPVYIDKPLALTRKDGEILMGLESWEGQIFSCSALYFADELKCSLGELKRQVGKLQNVVARTPKSWEKYAVHIVEPIIRTIGHEFLLVECKRLINGKSTHVSFCTDTGLMVQLLATGWANTGIMIDYIGDKGTVTKTFRDAFPAFKSALESFIDQVRTKEIQIPRAHTRKVVGILELGMRV